jgi:predicted nucleic acid-binding protein
MKYLFDTDMCVYLFKGKPKIVEKLEQIPAKDLAVSIITIAELEYGAFYSERVQSNLERIASLEKKIQTVAITSSVTREYAKAKAVLRKQGAILEDFDLLIAATALTHNLILVTNNTQHFNRIDNLRIENWLVA